ncbi:hypothetical protein [Mesobacterium pallidum]|uniref:hypothetical protein n=1 Tax=Mesobacterium pallidum TaxID=2872037 RepID=UPI001EE28393|nr:hypothetical protein [Mesobacterium pallidum]
MKIFVQRGLNFLLLSLGLTLMATLSLALIIWMLLGTEVPAIERIACTYNLTTSCVIAKAEAEAERSRDAAADRVRRAQAEAARIRAEAEARVQAKEAELAKLERRKAELQALHERLARIERRASDYAVFHKNKTGRYEVVTGHGYDSLLHDNRLVEAWCYMVLGRGNDLRTIYLARYSKIRGLKEESIPETVLREPGIDREVIAAHRARCIWPEGLS